MRQSAPSPGRPVLLLPTCCCFQILHVLKTRPFADREIFRVRDELAQYEGPEVTFYDFLGVTPAASQDEINKAYRKKSRSLHPDKVKQQLTAEHTKAKKEANKNKNKRPGVIVTKPPSASEVKVAVKAASDRQARLSIVANILRGSGRERYDHFMANGFPVWKGTGYYYNRYRPGLGTVMFGVFLSLGGGAHYLALYMGWKRQRDFVERYIKFARHAAWGDNLGINMPALDAGGGVPVGTAALPPPPAAEDEARAMPTNRRMRRLQERDNKRDAAQEGSRSGRRGARRLGARGAATASGSATPTPVEAGPQGAKKRVVAENGKILVVDSLGDVYLEQEDEEGNVELFLLDVSKKTRFHGTLVRSFANVRNSPPYSPTRSRNPPSRTLPWSACPPGCLPSPSAASWATSTRAATTPTSPTRRTCRTPPRARGASTPRAQTRSTTTLSCWTSPPTTTTTTTPPPRPRAASPSPNPVVARAASARARRGKMG